RVEGAADWWWHHLGHPDRLQHGLSSGGDGLRRRDLDGDGRRVPRLAADPGGPVPWGHPGDRPGVRPRAEYPLAVADPPIPGRVPRNTLWAVPQRGQPDPDAELVLIVADPQPILHRVRRRGPVPPHRRPRPGLKTRSTFP